MGLKKIVGNKTGCWTDYYENCRKLSPEAKLRLCQRKQDGDRDTPSVFWLPKVLKFYCQSEDTDLNATETRNGA